MGGIKNIMNPVVLRTMTASQMLPFTDLNIADGSKYVELMRYYALPANVIGSLEHRIAQATTETGYVVTVFDFTGGEAEFDMRHFNKTNAGSELGYFDLAVTRYGKNHARNIHGCIWELSSTGPAKPHLMSTVNHSQYSE